MSSTSSNRGSFATRLGIILATAGSSVGLGNIWRFPVETGEHGGAAFILIYLLCVIFLGVPMMTAEFIIGRRTHKDIASAYQELAPRQPWYLTGFAGMICVTLILSYYSVVAGWVLKYASSAIRHRAGATTAFCLLSSPASTHRGKKRNSLR